MQPKSNFTPKTIKIDFSDLYNNFDKKNNWIYKALAERYNVEISDEPDFLFYSVFGSEFRSYKNCVKIFITGENILPNFNECDYAQGFDYIDFNGRYFHKNCQIPRDAICNRAELPDDLFNRRFCNFIYSNNNSGDGALLRQEFCKRLMEYKHVDCPGKILNNMSAPELAPRNGDWWNSKQEFLNKYKFTIAFENSSSNGYTTEKLTQPLMSNSIPIYWGNPMVVRDFNPKAFINCNDYDNDFDAIIARIRELDNDPDKYMAMLRENPMQPDFDFDNHAKMVQWLYEIIERGNKPFSKDPRNIQSWMCAASDKDAKIKDLENKILALESENKTLSKRLTVHTPATAAPRKPTPQPFSELPSKRRGNFLLRHIERDGYVNTYVCGIRTRREPKNIVRFIDRRLQELERHICDMHGNSTNDIDAKLEK